jgi:hypothetical protein
MISTELALPTKLLTSTASEADIRTVGRRNKSNNLMTLRCRWLLFMGIILSKITGNVLILQLFVGRTKEQAAQLMFEIFTG